MNRYFLLACIVVASPVAADKPLEAPVISSAGQECRARNEAKEYEQALKPCVQAAEAGDVEAQNIVGYLYEKGNGVSRDLETALKWYRRAADKGHPPSQRRVAAAYYWGLGGVDKDEAKAFEWFKRAADGGDKRAQKQMAEAYRRGLGGLVRDEKLAREWAERAERADGK